MLLIVWMLCFMIQNMWMHAKLMVKLNFLKRKYLNCQLLKRRRKKNCPISCVLNRKSIISRRLLCVSLYPKNKRNTRTTSTLIRHRQKLKLYIREWKRFFLRMGVIFIIEDIIVSIVSNKNVLQQEWDFQDGIPSVLRNITTKFVSQRMNIFRTSFHLSIWKKMLFIHF